MSSSAKSTSEKALGAYFHDMAAVDVPTPQEEVEAFRKLLAVESRMVRLFLKVRGAEAELRAGAKAEEETLPRKLTTGSGLHPEVIGFVRMTDAGREWFQHRLALSVATKDSAVRALSAEREAIKNAFISANLRLTVSLAKRYSKHCKHQSMGDLIQEGNIGLMRAVDRFDPDRGFRFATYATWWIRHHVKRAVSDKEQPIRIPVHVADLLSKLSRIDGGYMAETGTNMNADQMAKAAKVPLEKVLAVMSSRVRVAHLDAPVGEEENMSLLDTIASKAFPDPLGTLFSERVRLELLDLLSGLTPTESRIIRYRFGFDHPERELTLQEIADQYNLSRERIRQIESKALEKLRRRMGGKTMGEYLLEAS
jgi:RNA polymerase sigma factor (sigma-70 family)